MSDPLSHFQAAVEVLVGDGPIKVRLCEAYDANLAELNVDSLPKDLRAQFDALRGSLTQVAPLNGEGSVAATVRKLSSQEANEHAGRIVQLLIELLRLAPARPAKSADKNKGGGLALVEADKVPRFLTKH